MYQKGKGVERNISKAIEYYKKAADLEDPTALYNLGSMYENGNGVELNISKQLNSIKKQLIWKIHQHCTTWVRSMKKELVLNKTIQKHLHIIKEQPTLDTCQT
ncbi:hypothetical protein M9Y10_019369 [Tritrichomonas musculus]|uniref:Uncharacterized protein n=1 Tax=Tritrichomonas musculus TaxID=1915356 RepID=A0ABR2HK27_9EUKA